MHKSGSRWPGLDIHHYSGIEMDRPGEPTYMQSIVQIDADIDEVIRPSSVELSMP